jgi:hypothetical protein
MNIPHRVRVLKFEGLCQNYGASVLGVRNPRDLDQGSKAANLLGTFYLSPQSLASESTLAIASSQPD